MNKVLHIATECYPAAKAGGMGDVVGALPIYLPNQGVEATVIIPKYKTKWFAANSFKTIHQDTLTLGDEQIAYSIEKLTSSTLDYPFYCVSIPRLFDRENIYLGVDGHGYKDEVQRNISFQIAILDWLLTTKEKFDLLHCHDHMTGLIPFMLKACMKYKELSKTPSLFTIHNGQYRGILDWSAAKLLPDYDTAHNGLLDWDGHINCLAAAIKCAWQVTTVSPAYMLELADDFDTLTPLLRSEIDKCTGVLNGIDNEIWHPAKDIYLDHPLVKNDWKKFKRNNKTNLIKSNNLKSRRPLFGFIGRLAYQKGADIIAEAISICLEKKLTFSTIILGSGDKEIEKSLLVLAKKHPRDISVTIAYDEKMAHQIYAGCDFLLMPSRFEPCGLNQMYAMRYGTIPVVTHVGGLKDTVSDINNGGDGIVTQSIDANGFVEGIERSISLYSDKNKFGNHASNVKNMDWSWNQSAQKYAELYQQFI